MKGQLGFFDLADRYAQLSKAGHLRKPSVCVVIWSRAVAGLVMSGQGGFWDFEDRLRELSAEGDPLERLSATVDFEPFRPVLAKARRSAQGWSSAV
jgi:hypothetical protein